MRVYLVCCETPLEPGYPVISAHASKEGAVAALAVVIAEEFNEDEGDVIAWADNKESCKVDSDMHGQFVYTICEDEIQD